MLAFELFTLFDMFPLQSQLRNTFDKNSLLKIHMKVSNFNQSDFSNKTKYHLNHMIVILCTFNTALT